MLPLGKFSREKSRKPLNLKFSPDFRFIELFMATKHFTFMKKIMKRCYMRKGLSILVSKLMSHNNDLTNAFITFDLCRSELQL